MCANSFTYTKIYSNINATEKNSTNSKQETSNWNTIKKIHSTFVTHNGWRRAVLWGNFCVAGKSFIIVVQFHSFAHFKRMTAPLRYWKRLNEVIYTAGQKFNVDVYWSGTLFYLVLVVGCTQYFEGRWKKHRFWTFWDLFSTILLGPADPEVISGGLSKFSDPKQSKRWKK